MPAQKYGNQSFAGEYGIPHQARPSAGRYRARAPEDRRKREVPHSNLRGARACANMAPSRARPSPCAGGLGVVSERVPALFSDDRQDRDGEACTRGPRQALLHPRQSRSRSAPPRIALPLSPPTTEFGKEPLKPKRFVERDDRAMKNELRRQNRVDLLDTRAAHDERRAESCRRISSAGGEIGRRTTLRW